MEAQPVPKPDFLPQDQWDWVLQTRSRAAQKAAGTQDAADYIKTGGKSQKFEALGGATLALTVIGRKSGKELTTALFYLEDGDNHVVIGSCAGLPEDPFWWLNLQANPHGWVQIGERRWPVNARKASAEERARLWPKVVEKFPLWGHFQKYVEREFPVIILVEDKSAA